MPLTVKFIKFKLLKKLKRYCAMCAEAEHIRVKTLASTRYCKTSRECSDQTVDCVSR